MSCCWTKAVCVDVCVLGSLLDKCDDDYQSAVLFAWVKIVQLVCLLRLKWASVRVKVDINALLNISSSKSTLKC